MSIADDCVLDAAIAPGAVLGAGGDPRAVLLTGATGHLGGALLERLLDAGYTVHCLVRAKDPQVASRRLRGLTAGRPDAAKARALNGDFTAPLLGLSPTVYDRLAETVSAVYHCGASADLTASYDLARVSNVTGTVNVLAFAAHRRLKTVHHVSTLGIFVAARRHGLATVTDDTVPDLGYTAGNGCATSKYVAETLIAQAAERGIPARVYRPGLLPGGADLGSGLFAASARLMAELRAAPLALGPPACTVGHAARAIAALAASPHPEPTRPAVYNVLDNHPLDWQEVSAALRACGHRVPDLPVDRWLTRLRRASAPAARAVALSGLVPYLFDLPDFRTETLPFLARRGVSPEPLTTALLTSLLEPLLRV